MNAIQAAIKYGGGSWVAVGLILLAAIALFGCGGELSIVKNVTEPPAQVAIVEAETKVEPVALERLGMGEHVYTVTSDIPSQDGTHRVDDDPVEVFVHRIPTPIPGGKATALVPIATETEWQVEEQPTFGAYRIEYDPITGEFRNVPPAP